MSECGLRNLIAHAVVNRQLRAKLLNGERLQVLARFDLSDRERGVLSALTADSLQTFAAQLESWMHAEGEYSPDPTSGRGGPFHSSRG